MRLQKFMAKAGVASRRKSEEIIKAGNVKVNDEIIDELGYKVDVDKDIIKVNGKIIKIEVKKIYILINKPTEYITSVSDQFNRKTVMSLIPNIDQRVYPVGRLDYDTSGLLLLTNDGDLTYKLTHPSHEINKTYISKVKGIPTKEELLKFRKGLRIEDYITSKAEIEILNKSKDSSILKIIIHEGKNRQVRKMCDAIGHPVLELKRIAMGNIELEDLKEGQFRYLDEDEINYLKKI
ncbi:rRNA pseudouridine synthase [Clostridium sp. D2Q-11]|uniref:Pseudouridine synthase n=1 Tax=Anaeromonas frigoriresistens TaxID=2683708 RepID=A0A942UXK5_9FIRM|nr:pseudouridine synthase [Anaeromonas frigoriresistens]MBS4539955.1 rRNA pseudouridine synthase [Anaeromonas frigoriresistens]